MGPAWAVQQREQQGSSSSAREHNPPRPPPPPPPQVFGPESSGKTTVALHAMAEVQKAGGTVVLVDAEHAFDPAFAKVKRIPLRFL